MQRRLSRDDFPKFINVKINDTLVPVSRNDLALNHYSTASYLEIDPQAIGRRLPIIMKLSFGDERFTADDVIKLLSGHEVVYSSGQHLHDDILNVDLGPKWNIRFNPLSKYEHQTRKATGVLETVPSEIYESQRQEDMLDEVMSSIDEW